MLNYSQILGNIVKKARYELGYTQDKVANNIDVDSRTILNIENGKGNPKLEVLFPLVRELKIDPGMIFYPEHPHTNSVSLQLQRLLSQCNEDELLFLIPVCETILTALRTNKHIQIQKEQ